VYVYVSLHLSLFLFTGCRCLYVCVFLSPSLSLCLPRPLPHSLYVLSLSPSVPLYLPFLPFLLSLTLCPLSTSELSYSCPLLSSRPPLSFFSLSLSFVSLSLFSLSLSLSLSFSLPHALTRLPARSFGRLRCQRVAVWYSVLQCGTVCCSVVQCVAVCCSMMQYDGV